VEIRFARPGSDPKALQLILELIGSESRVALEEPYLSLQARDYIAECFPGETLADGLGNAALHEYFLSNAHKRESNPVIRCLKKLSEQFATSGSKKLDLEPLRDLAILAP